jgi:hypothetical protein
MPAPPMHFHELHKIEACLGHDLCMRPDMLTQVGHLGFFSANACEASHYIPTQQWFQPMLAKYMVYHIPKW